MSACSNFRDPLLDHSLGLPAGAELEAHLFSCPPCAAMLAKWRARAEQIDAGVHRFAAGETAPFFSARLRAALASPPPRSWGRRRAAFATLVTVIGVCLLIFGARAAVERREQARITSYAAAVSNWTSPTQGLLRSPADPLLKTVPRLGESFFEIKPVAGEAKHERGTQNAN